MISGPARRCSAIAGLVVSLIAGKVSAAEPVTLRLWPDGVPDRTGIATESEHIVPPRDGAQWRLMNVSDPRITVYRPDQPNGAALIVAPGGGYQFLAIEHEGTEVCERLLPRGITCVLLRYRVPSRNAEDPGREALQDVQRAMGLVRQRSAEWGVHPNRVGLLGFSAGGHAAIRLALRRGQRDYPFNRSLDVEDPTPDFVVPVYPAYLVDEAAPDRLRPEFNVSATAPPICLVHAHDDRGVTTSAASALLYLEYKKRGLPAELHVYAKGGHGFGTKQLGHSAEGWLSRVVEWMGTMGWTAR